MKKVRCEHCGSVLRLCEECGKPMKNDRKNMMYCGEQCSYISRNKFVGETKESFLERMGRFRDKITEMRKKEAQFQTIFNQYIREKKINGYFELKYAGKDNFAFKKLPNHQLASLVAAENNGLVWKFSDQDQRQKPFDSISAPPMPAYIVIRFMTIFYMIPITKYINFAKSCGKVSMTLQDAESIAEHKCMY